VKWAGCLVLVACGSSTKPAPVSPKPDCRALVAHIEQLMGSPAPAELRNNAIGDCEQHPDSPLVACINAAQTRKAFFACDSRPAPLPAKFDCVALTAHFEQVMGKHLPPEDRERTTASCEQQLAADPNDPLIHCVANAVTEPGLIACMKTP